MPQVSLRINNRIFDMTCAEGEEQHLELLGAEVERRIEALRPQLLGAAEFFDRRLAAAGGTARVPVFAVHDPQRRAPGKIARTAACAGVLGEAALEIGRDAGVQRTVVAADDVDGPARCDFRLPGV